LKEDGWLVTGEGSRHLTVKMRLRGTMTRLWRLQASAFDD
jgi:hypothetical protein